MAARAEYPKDPAETPAEVRSWGHFAILPGRLAQDGRPGLRAAKLVLLALASYAGADRTAWPSVATLAEDTGLSRATVQRALSAAESAGYLERDLQDGRTTLYRLRGGLTHEAGGASPGRPPGASPVRPYQDQGYQDQSPGGPSGVLTDSSSPEPVPVTLSRTEAVRLVFDTWAQTMKAPGRVVLTAKRRARILDRLREGYEVEDLLDAVRGWQASPFNRGENRDGTVYNDLDLLLRSGAHVERFRDLWRSGGPQGRGPVSERARRQEALLSRALAGGTQALLGSGEES